MTTHEKALEGACKALIDADPTMSGYHQTHIDVKRKYAEAAITAFLSTLLSGDAGELVGRLQAVADENETSLFRGEVATIGEAAALITALVASNAEKDVLIAKKDAALEPFENAMIPDKTTISGWRFGTKPELEHYIEARRARSAKERE